MGFSPRLAPYSGQIGTFGSVATNASTIAPIVRFPVAGEVIGAFFVNGTAASLASATSTGGFAMKIYKNASATASRLGSFDTSGTVVATLGSAAAVLTSGSSINRFAAGDVVVAELVGGSENNSSTAGAIVQVDYILARESGATPSAGTGPA